MIKKISLIILCYCLIVSCGKKGDPEYKEPEKMSNMKKLWAERFKEFCDQTSLHGWSYLEKGETMKILTILKRIIWSLVIIGSAIACGLFVVQRIIEYVESDVIILTESRSESKSKRIRSE